MKIHEKYRKIHDKSRKYKTNIETYFFDLMDVGGSQGDKREGSPLGD